MCVCVPHTVFIKVVEQIQVMSLILSTIFFISALGKSPIHFTYQIISFIISKVSASLCEYGFCILAFIPKMQCSPKFLAYEI